MNEYCVENENHNQQIYVWVYKECIKVKKGSPGEIKAFIQNFWEGFNETLLKPSKNNNSIGIT